MNAKKERAQKTTRTKAAKRRRRKTEDSEASLAEAPQTAAAPIVKTFSSEPIDTRTGAGSGLSLVIRYGEQVDPSQWRGTHWELVMQCVHRCRMANFDPWSIEPLRTGRRTRAPDVQIQTLRPLNKLLSRFLHDEFLLRVGATSPTETTKLLDTTLAWKRDFAAKLNAVPPEEWLGVPAALIPSHLRVRVRQAATRGRIRRKAIPNAPRNAVTYCLADLLRTYPREPKLEVVRAEVLRKWNAALKQHAMSMAGPIALPSRLGELADALELLRASQRLASRRRVNASKPAAKMATRRKSDK